MTLAFMAKESLTYIEFQKAISTKSIAPVYLFYGKEDFLADEATQMIVEAAIAPEDRQFNLDVTYGNETNVRDVMARATSYPMMAERRVLIVRHFDRLSMTDQEKERIVDYLEHPLSSTVLVLTAQDADMRKKPYISAKKGGMVVECKPLYENQIPGWIEERVTSQRRMISPDAAKLLAEYVNPSLREVQSELDKLYVFVGERKSIEAEDVIAAVGISKDYNVFALQRTLGIKDIGQSCEIMARMLESGEPSARVIAMLTRYFVTLWKLHELRRRGSSAQELARATRTHPFFMKEYMDALDQISLRGIKRALKLLCEADEQLKTTSTDPTHVMQLLVVQVLSEDEGTFSVTKR
jgi:DNA polymerase III subunit delta